jgi:RNA polymerase sigma-70 factor (ECF subfamily)
MSSLIAFFPYSTRWVQDRTKFSISDADSCPASATAGVPAGMDTTPDTAIPGFDSLRTCASLLEDLGKGPEATRWEEFDRKYRLLVFGMARRSGLDHHDAQDLTQDVFRELTESLCGFQCGQRPGAFRRYLRNLVRWRVSNRLQSRNRRRESTVFSQDPESGADTLDLLPAPPSGPAEADLDFREAVTQAMVALAADLPPRDVQLLDAYFCKNWPAADVARTLGISRANVFTIAHRHKLRLIREILRRL